MAITDLSSWLDNQSGPGNIWYAKRLSGNDTLANESHQAGPYLPKDFLFKMFPDLARPDQKNPDFWFNLHIISHNDVKRIRAIWYNNKLHGGTRNETRLTGFGGKSSALLNPDNTGSLALFVFSIDEYGHATDCNVWVCRNPIEESLIEDRIGAIEPGAWRIWSADEKWLEVSAQPAAQDQSSCWLKSHEIPEMWLKKFPTGAEIIHKTVELRPLHNLTPDDRLLKRRTCEYKLFRSIEEAYELPNIQQNFTTIDNFIARAQTILQRRKTRSGRSLELHAKEIFLEEGLTENINFSHQPESDPGKRPDFIFPSESVYKNKEFPAERLSMLAVKTTLKDRWRQILSEADRVSEKHLLTLQEGVSVNQFREIREAGVVLVVPQAVTHHFHESIRPHLLSLENFIMRTRML